MRRGRQFSSLPRTITKLSYQLNRGDIIKLKEIKLDDTRLLKIKNTGVEEYYEYGGSGYEVKYYDTVVLDDNKMETNKQLKIYDDQWGIRKLSDNIIEQEIIVTRNDVHAVIGDTKIDKGVIHLDLYSKDYVEPSISRCDRLGYYDTHYLTANILDENMITLIPQQSVKIPTGKQYRYIQSKGKRGDLKLINKSYEVIPNCPSE